MWINVKDSNGLILQASGGSSSISGENTSINTWHQIEDLEEYTNEYLQTHLYINGIFEPINSETAFGEYEVERILYFNPSAIAEKLEKSRQDAIDYFNNELV